MTLQQIADRLAKEFPGRAVSIDLEVWSHRGGGTVCKLRAYDDGDYGNGRQHFTAATIEGLFDAMHGAIDASPAGAVEIETAYSIAMDGIKDEAARREDEAVAS